MITRQPSNNILKIFVFVSFIFLSASPTYATDHTLNSIFRNIWKYNNLSLTNLNRLFNPPSNPTISDIKSSDISDLNQVVKQNKIVLEEIINKPIYKILGDDIPEIKLQDKIDETTAATSNLFSGVQNLKSRTQLLAKKWPELTENDIKSELTIISSIFTQDLNQKDSNIIATTNWLKNSWDSPLMVNLSDEAQATQSQFGNLLNDTISFGKFSSANVLVSALDHIRKFEDLVGTSLAKSTDQSLYGYLKRMTDQVSLYESLTQDGMKILSEISEDPSINQSAPIYRLNSAVLGINHVPSPAVFFSTVATPLANENKILDLLALVDTNKILLSGKTGQVIKNIWMEKNENIIFKAIATNTSRTQSQKVMVRFSLPAEINNEQLINHDPVLAVNYDRIESSLVVSAELLLDPLETKSMMVEVEDIWRFNPSELASLKNEVSDITSYFSNTQESLKVSELKNEIVTSVDKIIKDQLLAITPESKISTFRESSLELNRIEGKIISLKSLALGSNANESVLGISGTFKTVPFKGIIIFVLLSVAFWAVYSNALKHEPIINKPDLHKHSSTVSVQKKYPFHHRNIPTSKGSRVTKMIVITLISGGIGAIVMSLALKTTSNNRAITIKTENETTTQIFGAVSDESPKKFPYVSQTLPPKSGTISVHSLPSASSSVVTSLDKSQTITIFKKIGHWVLIADLKDKNKLDGWWIHDSFLQ